MSRQHLSWQHLSILGISQLLLTRFWPNFEGGFLGPSLTDANCHGDICQSNICPGDICPYQDYLSCHWPNFDQAFGIQLLEASIFFDRNPFTKILLDPNFWDPKIFLDQKFCEHKIFGPKFLFGHKFFWNKFFLGINFLRHKRFFNSIFWT